MSTRKTEPLNTVIVSQASDLPFNASLGEHELQDNTLYRFDGFVTSMNPIRLGTPTRVETGSTGNSVENTTSSMGVVSITTDDTLDIRVANLDSTTDISVGEMNGTLDAEV